MASRPYHRILLGPRSCAPQHCCARGLDSSNAAEAPSRAPAAVSSFPIASDVRLAGDAKQTRFVLDLDKPIHHRAFVLADPYRVVVDIPQVSFKLPAGVGTRAGVDQGIPLRPGDAGRLTDRVRSAGPGQIDSSYVLDAANGQPPRLVLELGEVDRATFVQSLAPRSPARIAARDRRRQRRRGAAAAAARRAQPAASAPWS